MRRAARAVEVMQRDIRDIELERGIGGHARGHQILDDFMLRIDGDRMAGEFGQRDASALAFERQLEAVMQRAFGLHPLAETGFVQQVHRALFEHARANRRFDVAAAARFEHDGFDAAQDAADVTAAGPPGPRR